MAALLLTFIFWIFFIQTGIHCAVFTNQWAVHVMGGENMAKEIAKKHNYVYLGEIMPDYYLLHHREVAKRSLFASSQHEAKISQHPDVLWMQQQVIKTRVKRTLATQPDLDSGHLLTFNDPKWTKEWYLNRSTGMDMNVLSAWSQGFTGQNVVVTVLDDGIEKDHPDLDQNYDLDASYDVNSDDSDPQPRYESTNFNRHGTRCAGEIAAEANNNICAVGVAYDARIGGIRMLDGDVTDAVEARSFSHNPQHVDIYSISWGPDDDGRTVDGPAALAQKAISEGAQTGRSGLGSIYVYASGNGRSSDSCGCDGYTNSLFIISVSSASEQGKVPWYSEPCASTIAATFSSGSASEKKITTTDLRHLCTESHTGTSASSPLAAGVCALALSANPALTWRDMQHIIVATSNPGTLQAPDWATNGVGRKVSHSFGYGLMDAGAMVTLAKNWTTVPEQHRCEMTYSGSGETASNNEEKVFEMISNGCENTSNVVLYLEHVQSVISLSAKRRGNVEIYLTSAVGTRSTLLTTRPVDSSSQGFNNWAFMTVHNWGETPVGTWRLTIRNGATTSRLQKWTLVLYGTAVAPEEGTNGTEHSRPTTTAGTPGEHDSNDRSDTFNFVPVVLAVVVILVVVILVVAVVIIVRRRSSSTNTQNIPASVEGAKNEEGAKAVDPRNRSSAVYSVEMGKAAIAPDRTFVNFGYSPALKPE